MPGESAEAIVVGLPPTLKTRIWLPLLLGALACSLPFAAAPAPPPTAPASPEPAILPAATAVPKSTPVSQEPAAGICAEPDLSLVTMIIYPDIPDPRCIRVSGSQFLQVTNQSGRDLEIGLGPYKALVPNGATYVFGPALGEFLEPGVHPVLNGGEIWLK